MGVPAKIQLRDRKLPRLLTLQAARGVAANLVVLAHLHAADSVWAGARDLPTFWYSGTAGVDLFFVLSGFVMVAIAGRNVGPLEFIWRRAARIYPTYWLTLSALLSLMVAHAVIHSYEFEVPGSLWRSLLLIPQRSAPLLPVSWTLVFEMYFYLIFTIFLATRVPLIAGLAAWTIVVCVIVLVTPDHVANSPIAHVVANPMIAEFMIGGIIGILWRHRFLPGHLIAGTIGLGALAVSIGYLAPSVSLEINRHFDAWRVVLFGVPAALILYGLAGTELLINSLPLPTLMVKLGDWSYATYLMHWLVIPLVAKAFSLVAPAGGAGPSALFAVSGVIAANLTGAMVHVFFERPTLRRLNKLGAAFTRPRLQADRVATK